MRKEFCQIYIGYLTGYYFHDPVVLCVGDEKHKVKYYLKEIRGLNKDQYEIREVVLDWNSAYALYEDYILEEFDINHLYLTNRDIAYINHEIDTTLEKMEGTYSDLKEYRKIISRIDKLSSSIRDLDQAIGIMEHQLSKVKTLRRIGNSIIENSIVFTKNVMEYLQQMGYLQEEKELTETFYRKVYEEET